MTYVKAKIGKIEKGINIEDYQIQYKYPFEDMVEVGDSFFVWANSEDIKTVYKNLSGSIYYWQKKLMTKYEIRLLKREGGVRVWRTK